jgi:hypothetical protein
MLRDTQRNARQKKGKRSIRFRGLVAAAREFGVHRNHLYLCLAGKRVSRSLIAKWKDLKCRTAKAA